MTGFGSDGPYADRPAYDIIVEALGGVMSVTGPFGGPSVRAGVPIGDIGAGLYAVIATLGGLRMVAETGKGAHLDVGMLDCQISCCPIWRSTTSSAELVPTHQGRAHLAIPTYNTFATKDDSEIVIAANTDEMWRSLCRVLGRMDLTEDPRFITNPERLKHKDELLPILETEFLKWTSDDLDKALVAAEVPVAPIKKMDEALTDVQVKHRDMVVRAPHRGGGEFLTVGVPIKADHAGEGSEFLTPPGLGQHTVEVMHSLGYTDEQIAELEAAGALAKS